MQSILPANLDPRRLERVSASALERFLDRAAALGVATPNGYCRVAGGVAALFGVGGPSSVVRGAALDSPWTERDGDEVLAFYARYDDSPRVDVCPLTGSSLRTWLERRGATVRLRLVAYGLDLTRFDCGDAPIDPHITLEEVDASTVDLQRDVVSRGFGNGAPPSGAMAQFIADMAKAQHGNPFAAQLLARIDGVPAGGGRVTWVDVAATHGGGRVAIMQGASTLPDARRRGVQSALLRARLARARAEGCDAATISCEPGSASERNIVRAGFVPVYEIERYDVPRA
ncbi:MAG: GNAT family N-acetyltransferase [Phycisphaerales bacterium]